MEIEDLFAPAFTNAYDGRPANMDSYMSIMSYDIVEKIFTDIRADYPDELWKEIIDYWNRMGYVSPMCKLLSSFLKRKME